MRLRLRRLACAMLLVAAACLVSNSMAFAQSPEETEIAQAVEALRKALLEADKDRLEGLIAEQMTYGDLPNGVVVPRGQFIAPIVGKKTLYKSILIAVPTTTVASGVGIVRHVFVAERETDGKDTSVHVAVLQVWQKQGSSWKLLVWQAFNQA
jgi:uncharacterized protein DUF4440